MSQVARILGAKVTGSVYLGEREGGPAWSRDSQAVLSWLADGWRFRFNQHRSRRKKYVRGFGDQAGADTHGRVLVHLGSGAALTDKQARLTYSHLSALPAQVLQSPERLVLQSRLWRVSAA